MKMTGTVLTNKGMVKANARKTLMDFVADNRDVFAKATRNENGTFSLAVTDESGNVVFVNFDVSVSTMNAADRTKSKSKAKAKTEAPVVVE